MFAILATDSTDVVIDVVDVVFKVGGVATLVLVDISA